MDTSRSAFGKLVLILDTLIVLCSMGLSFLLHGALRHLVPQLKDPPSLHEVVHLIYLTLPLFLGLIVVFRLHHIHARGNGRAALLWGLVKVHLAALVGVTVLLFVTQAVINRSLVALFLGCTFVLTYFQRLALLAWRRYQHRRGVGQLRLLLVGQPGPLLRRFARRCAAGSLPPRVLGYLGPDDDTGDDTAPDTPRTGPRTGETGAQVIAAADSEHLPTCLGRLECLPQVLHDEAVDRVLFFPPLRHPTDAEEAVRTCAALGVPADFALSRGDRFAEPPRVVSHYDLPFVSLEGAPRSDLGLALKHAFDLALAGLALLLLAPLLVLLALAVLLSMGRPVMFVQRRTGLHGRVFRMLKFRTMVTGAEGQRDALLGSNEMSGPVFKASDDPRITRLGRLLRRSSLDELPQLLNVLKGDMSLVGPRPLPVQEQQEIHGMPRRRLSLKPGITGLWQVSGRNAVDFEEWMALDLEYVDHWSLWLDLRILARTLPAVLFRKGAV